NPLPAPPAAKAKTRAPVLASPVKRRHVRREGNAKIVTMTDLELKDVDDDKIIRAHKDTWNSNVYDHYSITIRRNEQNGSIDFIFTCATHPENHPSLIIRPRKNTSHGTSNLRKQAVVCDKKQGKETSKKISTAPIKYSEGAHRVLIALRCAKYGRPFNMVSDEEYLLEVQMLRPETKVPLPITVQRDLIHIYEHASTHIRSYFQVCSVFFFHMHIIIDTFL
ncbi:hypothetical protein BJ165DRAFT_1583618, partial [Panaeolus papilionaceus]